jgi:seryl-tRNA synthetase
MLDPKLIRSDLEAVVAALGRRGYVVDEAALSELEGQRRSLQAAMETLQAERNSRSKQIGALMKQGDQAAADAAKAEVARLKAELESVEAKHSAVAKAFEAQLLAMPNLPADVVPEGKEEADNVELERWGAPRTFSFTPKDHVDLGQGLGGMDFEVATRLTGSRFVVLKGTLARLHRALAQFMLDLHTEAHGYEEVNVPVLVNSDSMQGTGQLPKFAEDSFHLAGESAYWLAPTAEVPVTNLVRGELLDEGSLPRAYVAHTLCFRSEAGSYGRDTRGMIRQHQFEKVELVHITRPEDSWATFDALVGHAEAVLQKLALPYRKVLLCGGDLGFSSAQTIDLEVWLPAQNCYREISSCSNFLDFQARRMGTRYKAAGAKQTTLVHTLNGSGLAVGRTLVAVLENYQEADGSIRIPEVLQPYLGGQSVLAPQP